ncbi:putative solute carrier family 22 member 31 [Lepisosteus oculatus]|uniref:Solute carrier family 22 member 31 n=1 Tax=Lepisosteus oculatus TaxID=7918 RepID=W5MAU1_LEPOC|nr:PREDICTED: putative solute carrier family 22 member 31 [Lepisosteus oculatus]
MDFETRIYPQIGGFGRYNRLVAAFTWVPSFAVALSLCSELFFTSVPGSYHCKRDPSLFPAAFQYRNLSAQELVNLTIPWARETGLSRCELYRYPANVSNFTKDLSDGVVSCTVGWEYTEAAGLESNFVTEWDLVCDSFWKVPLEQVCFMTGWILGYILLGCVCDRLGRRRVFLCSAVLSGLLGFGVCVSISPAMFLLLRLSQGGNLAGLFLSSYVTRLELCDSPHRLMVTVIGGLLAVCGELLLPGLAVLCRDWPVLQAVVTLPLLMLLSYWWCASVFPESPRWLLATRQISSAKRVLLSFSLRNRVCLGDDICASENLLAEIDLVYTEDCRPRFHNVCELAHTRVIWKNCLILGFTGFIGAGIQYCFTRNLLGFQPHFYFSYFLRVLAGGLACALLWATVNRFGRRGMLLLSSIVTGMASLLLLALTQYLMDGFILVLSIVGLLSSQAMAMLSVFFASEVMPTVVRGATLGLVLAAGCVGQAASSLMELQSNSGYFLHHVVFASFAVLSVLCIMLLPESKRKPLPDSLKEGENQRRPPLFLSRDERDSLPLLQARPRPSDYNPDNYSRLVSATKKMLSRDALPFRMAGPLPPPLLSRSRDEQAVDNEDS